MSVLGIVAFTVGALIVSLSAVLVLGAFAPRLRYIGAYGSLSWPTLIGPATLFNAAGVGLVVWSYSVVGPVAVVFGCLGSAALAGTLVILGDQILAAARVGASLRPDFLFALSVGPKVSPDATETYSADPDGDPLRLIIYRPRRGDNAGPAPVIVYVHGGGWFQGSPDENSAMLRWFADRGYLVVSPQYSLATDERPTWDLAMPQIGCALIWVAEHAREYGADPDRIAVWGASAGANLALATTYAAATGQLRPSCAGRVPRVAAVAGEVPAVDPAWIHDNTDPVWGPRTKEMVTNYIGGSTDAHPARLAAIQVGTYLSSEAPPTLLTVSCGDHLVPVQGVRMFVDQAQEAGVDVRAVYRRWGDHVIAAIYDSLSSRALLHLVLQHFQRHGV